MSDLTLERRAQPDRTVQVGSAMLPPDVGEDYWTYRVKLSPRQALLGFPKFTTVGIGFAVESVSPNTNRPYQADPEVIYRHIALNKGRVADDDVRAAIRMIQAAVRADRGEPPEREWTAAPGGSCRVAGDRAVVDVRLTAEDGDEFALSAAWYREAPDARRTKRWTRDDRRWEIEYDGRGWWLNGPQDSQLWGVPLREGLARSLADATELIARGIARCPGRR